MNLESETLPQSSFSALASLEGRVKASWKTIHAAETRSNGELAILQSNLATFTSSDSSLIAFGSLARREFTTGSDLDWVLLLDGISRPEHFEVALAIRSTVEALGRKQPGVEGTFGTLVASHDLVHRIGGEDDSNANTTLRILLLLESAPIGHDEAYNRVLNNVLWRYFDEDRGLWKGSGDYKVPRFMFNDVARYWRTMTVDFAYKQRDRQNRGFALRNLKLRMSRKLLFLAGMVACFECHTGFSSPEERGDCYARRQVQDVINRVRQVLSKPPLEIIAAALLRMPELDSHSKNLFDAYDEFLDMLSDDRPVCDGRTVRDHLNKLPLEKWEADPVATRGREISHRFRDAIAAIFLDSTNELGRLTIEYGVF